MKKFIAASLLLATVSGTAQAMALAPVDTGANATIIQVAGGCGPGWHRGPNGGCLRNFADPAAHACPRGFHIGPAANAAATGGDLFRSPNLTRAGWLLIESGCASTSPRSSTLVAGRGRNSPRRISGEGTLHELSPRIEPLIPTLSTQCRLCEKSLEPQTYRIVFSIVVTGQRLAMQLVSASTKLR